MTRKEAIEAIKMAQAQVEWDYPMDYAAAFDMAIEALKQPERVHAHWVDSTRITRCSHCKTAFSLSCSQLKFCPNCGAIMDEEK